MRRREGGYQALRPIPPGRPMDLYEQVPYPSLPYKQSHPDRLATLAHLFGLRPRRVTRSRVIEIGCNAGGNLIPMAATLPGTHFVGVDGSAAAIESPTRSSPVRRRIQAGVRNGATPRAHGAGSPGCDRGAGVPQWLVRADR